MAGTGIQTGQGATLTFGTTSTFAPAFTTIGGPSWTRDSIDTTALSTTGARTQIGADLWAIGAISSTYLMDPSTLLATEANSIQDLLFDAGAMTVDESASNGITLTLFNTEASTFWGTGHITSLEMEELTTDSLIAASLTFQWNDTPTITE